MLWQKLNMFVTIIINEKQFDNSNCFFIINIKCEPKIRGLHLLRQSVRLLRHQIRRRKSRPLRSVRHHL